MNSEKTAPGIWVTKLPYLQVKLSFAGNQAHKSSYRQIVKQTISPVLVHPPANSQNEGEVGRNLSNGLNCQVFTGFVFVSSCKHTSEST